MRSSKYMFETWSMTRGKPFCECTQREHIRYCVKTIFVCAAQYQYLRVRTSIKNPSGKHSRVSIHLEMVNADNSWDRFWNRYHYINWDVNSGNHKMLIYSHVYVLDTSINLLDGCCWNWKSCSLSIFSLSNHHWLCL